MKDLILHSSGREIDLSRPTQADERLLRDILARWGRTPRGELRCRRHGGDLYLVDRGDRGLWASHWPGTGGSSHRVGTAVSPEHERQVEYMARAADLAGLPTATEVVVPNTRLDLVVAERNAFEIQHSDIAVAAVKARTTKAMRAGMDTATWVSDREQPPAWMGMVPGVRVRARWDRLPGLGEAKVVGGLAQLSRERCSSGLWRRCPETGGRPCSGWHLYRRPAYAVSLDDITVGLARGLFRPVLVGRYTYIARSADADAFDAPAWAPPAARLEPVGDRSLCRTTSGWASVSIATAAPAPVVLTPPVAQARPAAHRTPFRARAAPRACVYGCPDARLYVCGWRCDTHRPDTAPTMITKET